MTPSEHTPRRLPSLPALEPRAPEPISRCKYLPVAAGAQGSEFPPTGKEAGRGRLVSAGWASLRSVFGVAITFLEPRRAGWKLTSAHPETSSTPFLPQRASPGPAPTHTEPLPSWLPKDLQGSPGRRREIRSRAVIGGARGFQTAWQPARRHMMGPRVTSSGAGAGAEAEPRPERTDGKKPLPGCQRQTRRIALLAVNNAVPKY